MLGMDVIEPAQAEWASPIMFAPKKNGSLPLCIDYRKPSIVTVKDAYSISQMGKRLYSLCETHIFPRSDTRNGHCKIEIDDWDKKKSV